MKQGPAVISLFSGAGGLDYGFEAAGFRTAVCVEMNRDACRTLAESRPKWPVFNEPIEEVASDDLRERGALGTGTPTVLIGGPPCQPFSKSGYWATGDSARLLDPRADTLREYLRVLEDLRPDAFLLENVVGLRFSGKDEGLMQLLDGIRAINARRRTRYDPVVKVLNAAEYGVPQVRERVFIIGAKDGTPFRFPEPTHGGERTTLFDTERQPVATAWDAIGHLNKVEHGDELALRGKWATLLASIPRARTTSGTPTAGSSARSKRARSREHISSAGAAGTGPSC